MKPNSRLTILAVFFSTLILAACSGIGGPTVETIPDDALAPAGESAPGLEEEPANSADAAYPPASEVDAAPQSAESPAAPADESYPAPVQETETDANTEAYPAPQNQTVIGAVEAYPGAEEQTAAAPPQAYPGPQTEAYPGAENAAAAVDSVEAPAPGSASLTGRAWLFQQFNGPDGQAFVPDQNVPELNSVEFFADGRVSIIAGCNAASGRYTASGAQIAIDSVQRTNNSCDRSSLGAQFQQWLDESAVFELSDDSLTLSLPDDAGDLLLKGTRQLDYSDQYAGFVAFVAGLGAPDAQPQTIEELLDVSLQKLVYSDGDDVNSAFGKAPGAVVFVQSPEGSLVKASGLASVEENRPMSALDRLEIGSNTKMFTGVLLTQMQEEGLLSLDDPLSKWLPDLAQLIPNGAAMTLRHLATHTSGIADYGDAIIGAGAADSEAMRSGYSPQELVLFAVENAPPDFAPGEPNRWQYSNTGYILLGMVLEAASGQTYGDLLQTRIFDPLGMSSSALLTGSPEPGSTADGYFIFPFDHNTTEWNASQGWSAGGIVSTAADMGRFAHGLMSGALFQDPATLLTMTEFVEISDSEQVASVGGTGYGIGLIEFAPGLYGHRGQTLGFTSIVAMDPTADFLLVALTNSAEGAVQREQKLMGQFLGLTE